MANLVTVAGVEKLEDVLERAPNTGVIVWSIKANFLESATFGPSYPFFCNVEVLSEDISFEKVWSFFFYGLEWPGYVENPFHLCLSPADAVSIFERKGFEITRDIVSSAVLKNTARK